MYQGARHMQVILSCTLTQLTTGLDPLASFPSLTNVSSPYPWLCVIVKEGGRGKEGGREDGKEGRREGGRMGKRERREGEREGREKAG